MLDDPRTNIKADFYSNKHLFRLQTSFVLSSRGGRFLMVTGNILSKKICLFNCLPRSMQNLFYDLLFRWYISKNDYVKEV